MIYVFHILGFIVAFVLYVTIAVVIHGLFERRNIYKYGHTFKDTLMNVEKVLSPEWDRKDTLMNVEKVLSPEWDRAYCAKDFAVLISVLWPIAPLLYVLRFCIRILSKLTRTIIPLLEKLHNYVVHLKESIGATNKDSK